MKTHTPTEREIIAKNSFVKSDDTPILQHTFKTGTKYKRNYKRTY